VHTDSPETSVDVVADQQPSTGLRRRLIGAGLFGLAGSLAPRFASRAAAAPEDTAAPTTTEAPQRPDADDVELLGFAQSIELAAAELYEMAMASGSLSDETMMVVDSVHRAHVSYGQSLNALLGRSAPGESAAEIVDVFGAGFGGSEDEFLTAAYELEDTAVATHQELIGQIRGTDGAQLVASMLIAEARHSTVFADLAGETDLDVLIFTAAEAVEPAEG
jgi:hypothetical protein